MQATKPRMCINTLNCGMKGTLDMLIYRIVLSLCVKENSFVVCVRNRENSRAFFGERVSLRKLQDLRLKCEVFAHRAPGIDISRNGDGWAFGHGVYLSDVRYRESV